jgi:prephenate dehydratase
MPPSTPPERGPGRPRVAYLGPEGTFSEEALLESAREGAVEPVGLETIYDAVMALRRGEVEWAIAPIENSLEGSISTTLDLLADDARDLEVVAEVLLRVRHSLIASAAIELGEIEAVLSHPQVLGQCSRFLRTELGRARLLPASSTAEAVRRVADEGRPTEAALGTVLAATIYGGTVLREGVEDNEDNETRFVWLARAGAEASPPLRAPAAGPWRTSLMFWGPGAERAGWLVRCLDEFARREINLTKIESRPRRERLGSYMFFADLTGRAEEPLLAEAIAGVRALCEEVRVLGSYPAAEQAPRGASAPATLRR